MDCLAWKADKPKAISPNQVYIKLSPHTEDPSKQKLRFSLQHIRLIRPPTFFKSYTTFRFQLTPELRRFATTFHTRACNLLKEHYSTVFKNTIPDDVLEEGLQLIHSGQEQHPYFQLRFQELYDNLRSIDTTYTYTMDVELRGVFLKESKVVFDWRLVQVMIKEPVLLTPPTEDDLVGWDYEEPSDILPDPDEVAALAKKLEKRLLSYLETCQEKVAAYSRVLDQLQAIYHTYHTEMPTEGTDILSLCNRVEHSLTELVATYPTELV
jgi:hypothetical protein